MSSFNSQLGKLREECAKVWDVTSDMTIAEALEQYYKLSPETEADPGSYDIVNNPYWRKVLNCCDDPEVRRVAVLKSTQVGGTILTQGILLACAVVDPAPAMYVTPTMDEFRIQRNRMFGNALVSERPFRSLVPPKSRWSMTANQLGAMKINCAWAGSPQRLRGKPCKRIIKNECDVFDYNGDAGNPHKAADERTKQFPDSLIFDESTPVGDESYIYGEWEKSNQERWHVRCPHCSKVQEMRFFCAKAGKYAKCGGVSGYRNSEGDLLEPEEAKKKAFYVCLNGCRIEQNHKNSMIRGGVWIPRGQKARWVDGKWVLEGKPVRDREHSGFHVWTMMQSKISIGTLAAAFVEHFNEGKMRDFFQNWLGLRYRVGTRIPSWEVVGSKFARQYKTNTVPDVCWFMTGAVDVQEELVYWLVLGWAPNRTPYLISWGELFKDEVEGDAEIGDGIILASDLKKVPDVLLNRRWPVANGSITPNGKSSLPVLLGGIDSNYRTHEVHDLVRSWNNEDRFRCIRGDDKVGSQLFKRSVIEKNSRTGEAYEGGLVQWQIYRTHYQDKWTERLQAAPNQAGALHLPEDIMPAGKKLLRQMVNVKKNQKGYYEIKDGQIGKDYRDLVGYCEALADMAVGKDGWSESKWRRKLIEKNRRIRAAIERREKPREDIRDYV